MLGISATRLIIYGIIAAAIGVACWMLWDSIYEKGKNFVYAQDNAALVKAQQQQAARDAVLIASQNSYINTLQNSGNTVKEKIRVVPSQTCQNDGRTDPRVGDAVDWLRGGAGDNGAAPGGPQPKAAVPAAR